MADVIALRMGSWLTAMAIEHLAGYFEDGVERGLGKWMHKLKLLTTSVEAEAIEDMHEELRGGMAALSASISAVNHESREGTARVLRALVELRGSQHHDQQLRHLKKAVDAMNDLRNGMYRVGNPKNIGLLERASTNAQEAARIPNGNLETTLQAYRLWVVTEYMHEVTTSSCTDAKKTAITILGRVILRDPVLRGICQKYSSPRTRKEPPAPEVTTPTNPDTADWTSWSGGMPMPTQVCAAIEFLLDISSSVAMLPPLDEDVSCVNVITAEGDGLLTLGPEAPPEVIFAIGRYCASNPLMVQTYPSVSALGLAAWEAGKEKLAMDNFFVSMWGEGWQLNRGWMRGGAELSERFGLTIENGHVTKINLAGNNLQGFLNEDLADCEHLRELVLHGNNIVGAVPPRLQQLINSKPDMVVTGLPGPGTLEACAFGSGSAALGQPRAAMRDSPQVPKMSFSRSSSFCADDSRGFSMISAPASSTDRLNTFASPGGSVADSIDGSRGNMRHPKRSKSFLKKAASFLKDSVGSNFDVGFEFKCKCGRKIVCKKNEKPVCTWCQSGPSAPEAWR